MLIKFSHNICIIMYNQTSTPFTWGFQTKVIYPSTLFGCKSTTKSANKKKKQLNNFKTLTNRTGIKGVKGVKIVERR